MVVVYEGSEMWALDSNVVGVYKCSNFEIDNKRKVATFYVATFYYGNGVKEICFDKIQIHDDSITLLQKKEPDYEESL